MAAGVLCLTAALAARQKPADEEIKNYVKPNDKVTLPFNQQAKAIQSLQILSYLNDPKDVVGIDAQYSQLPDGTNHISNMQINGISNGLVVAIQKSNYKKTM